jgi:hypothetical protein
MDISTVLHMDTSVITIPVKRVKTPDRTTSKRQHVKILKVAAHVAKLNVDCDGVGRPQ